MAANALRRQKFVRFTQDESTNKGFLGTMSKYQKSEFKQGVIPSD
jgi:hypothetical protein